MATIHIGITHDHYFMISQLTEIQSPRVLFGSDSYPESRIHVFDLFVLKNLVLHGFFHIQDFYPEGQDGLEFPVVFIAGCEDGLVPFTRTGGAAADPAEERLVLGTVRAGTPASFVLPWGTWDVLALDATGTPVGAASAEPQDADLHGASCTAGASRPRVASSSLGASRHRLSRP